MVGYPQAAREQKESSMLIKATLTAAWISAASLPLATALHAQELANNNAMAAISQSSAASPKVSRDEGRADIVLRPAPEAPNDIVAGRGPNPHAREYRQIAIYDSIGNEDGAAIVAGQLRTSGVSKQTIERGVSQAKVHATSRSASPRQSTIDADQETGWEASQ